MDAWTHLLGTHVKHWSAGIDGYWIFLEPERLGFKEPRLRGEDSSCRVKGKWLDGL